jgi:hypothetical protein
MLRRPALVVLLLVACCGFAACGGKKKAGLAELTKADGPVDKQEGSAAWAGAPVGTQFALGDAARTADGGAELKLAGTQLVAMNPHTILRFTAGKNNSTNINVELGGIDVINSSSTSLDIGDVKVAPGGKIRITADKRVELLIGTAQLTGADGKAIDLVIGTPMSMEIGPVQVADAGVDAPGAPPDAAIVAGDVEYDIAGKGVELQAPNEKTWTPAAEGHGTIPQGAKLRIKKAGSKAKLVQGTTTLELSGASTTITIGENLLMGLDLGTGVATVPAAANGKVGVPGGTVELTASQTAPAEAHIDVNARGEAKVAMAHGTAKLVGTGGTSTLEMAGGESATLLKAGTINPGVIIPKYFDFQVKIGEAPRSFAVHDPKGSTALQFAFNGKCPGGGTIEADHDARFRTPRVSEGKETANMLLGVGSWAWRLKCGNVAATGQVSVLHDNGRRPLPAKQNKNTVDADGRTWAIGYQSLIPTVEFRFKGTGSAFKLHLATGGAEEVYESSTPTIEVDGKKLKEGTYTFFVEHDGQKQDKISTLKITFDQTSVQVYIESPIDGQPFGAEVDVAGAALPGWTAKVDTADIPIIDTSTRRFKAKVPPPSGGAQALAIRLSHPQRGVHFYLRRGGPLK